jgi:hypothetical protein
MAKIFSQLEKAQLENTTSDAINQPKGMVTYRTDQNVAKVSDGAVYREIVDTSTAQSLSNKTFAAPIIDRIVFDDQVSTPSNPPAGFYKAYVKTDGKLYLLDSAGVETPVGAGGGGGLSILSPVSYPYAIAGAGLLVIVDTSQPRTLTLPSPSVDAVVGIKDVVGLADLNPITIQRFGAELIEGLAQSYVAETAWGSWTFVSDGTNWFLI